MMIYEIQEILRENVRPITIRNQNTIMYETEKFQKNVRPYTTMCENIITYETQKILTKVF